LSKGLPTIKDFLETYIRNKEIKNRPTSYGDYLRSTNRNFEKDYKDARLTAALSAKLSGGSHGTVKESLASRGLTTSGYAEHLARGAEEKFKSTTLELAKKRDAEERSARSGYLKYLSEYDAKQRNLKNKVVSALVKGEIIDTGAAYLYGIEAGLTPEEAESASRNAYTQLRRALRLKVISEMFKHNISPESAADYARELGLREEDALDIAKIAKDYMHNSDAYSKEYLEYIESIGNKNTGSYAGG